jgi:hypothetical protein
LKLIIVFLFWHKCLRIIFYIFIFSFFVARLDKAEYLVLYQPLMVENERCFMKNLSTATPSTTHPSRTPAEENPGLCCKKLRTDACDTA